MTDNLTIQLFKSFQEEVQDTTHKEEVPSQSELQDNELKSNESSDFLFDASCSNCLKEFTTSSLKANLLDQICGECNENLLVH